MEERVERAQRFCAATATGGRAGCGERTECMRNLLQNDEHSDTRQHSLDDGGGKVVRDAAQPDQPEGDLKHAGQHYRHQECFPRAAQSADGPQHYDGKPRGRAADP